MIYRIVENDIEEYLRSSSHKIFFLWGPRRSGKTTILKALAEKLKVPYFNFDLFSDQEKFIPEKKVLEKLKTAGPVILIDEVQNHPESTKALKILHDEFQVKMIATGSSELRQKTKAFESLAGRFVEYHCLPLSLGEIKKYTAPPPYEEREFSQNLLETLAVFGAYPEVYASSLTESQKIDLLQNMVDTFVLKDIVTFYALRNTKLAKDLLTKIALQIGQEVSLRELANSLGANLMTVSNYIEIFIKNYILVALPSFKTNMRRAVSRHRKFFFLDLGLRNALVKDFRPLHLRPDKGGVFENFIISEIYKKIKNDRLHVNMYFYREYGGREIDLVLENYQKQYQCFEIKHISSNASSIFPIPHKFSIINSANYFDTIESYE